MRSHTQADADGNGKVSDTEFKNALLQSPGLSDDDIGKIYLSSKTTDDSTDEKAQTFNATYGPRALLIICTCNIWSVPTTRQKLTARSRLGRAATPTAVSINPIWSTH